MENESTLEINLKNAKSRLEAAHSICSSLIKENTILKSRAPQFESTLKETMKVIDELKEKLKIATEALSKIELARFNNPNKEMGDLLIYKSMEAREALEKLKEMEK